MAILAVHSVDSAMRGQERVATAGARIVVGGYVMTVVVLLATLLLAGVALTDGDGGDALFAFAMWVLVGGLSIVLLGRSLAWALPVMSLFPLLYLDPMNTGVPAWWNWPARLHTGASVWLVATWLGVTTAAVVLLKAWTRRWPGASADG